MPVRVATTFIEPMLLLRTDKLPDDASRWEYQVELDGYRAVAFTAEGQVHLQSRTGKDFGARYDSVLKGLTQLPADTVRTSSNAARIALLTTKMTRTKTTTKTVSDEPESGTEKF